MRHFHLKYTHLFFGRALPGPTGGAYSTPQTPSWALRGREREGRGGERREGKSRGGERGRGPGLGEGEEEKGRREGKGQGEGLLVCLPSHENVQLPLLSGEKPPLNGLK